ncbi:MAG: response regulator transcription factor [Desulfobacterales bacterium]|nr:response regulator transcription factor [Desulfobacterales bacterium]
MSVTVLLVEDDFDLAETVVQYLELEGLVVDHALNGVLGLNLVQGNSYDVLVLDVMMPRMDGLTLCSRLREMGDDTPVLMLTARDTLEDKLAGFRSGSDDYLVKPFEMAELAVRIQTLAKRRSGQARKLRAGELVMDLDRREAFRGTRQLKLTPLGWRLLRELLRQYPKVVARRHLETVLWGDELPESNSLKVHLHGLRRQVDGPENFKMIQTVPGHGVGVVCREDT